MRHIKIEYKTGLMRRTVMADIPEQYSEMSARQFHALMRMSRGEIAEDKFLVEFFGIKARLWSSLDKFHMFMLTDLLRNLKDSHKVSFFFDKRFTFLRKTFVSPSQRLAGMTLQQFMSIDHFYCWYNYTGNVAFLYKFISCLFLREGESFFDLELDNRAEFWRKKHKEVGSLYEDIVINWMLVKNWLSSSYTYLFPATEEPPHGEPERKVKKVKPASWTSFFDALVGDDLVHIDKYGRLPVMDVFRLCNNRIKEQQKKKLRSK